MAPSEYKIEDADYRTRVASARTGTPVSAAAKLMQAWSIPVAPFAAILGISERSWSRLRAAAAKEPSLTLGPVESDRLLRLQGVLDHARRVFDRDEDALAWFGLPNRALSGDTPMSLMDTDPGVREVDKVLTRLEFGVFG